MTSASIYFWKNTVTKHYMNVCGSILLIMADIVMSTNYFFSVLSCVKSSSNEYVTYSAFCVKISAGCWITYFFLNVYIKKGSLKIWVWQERWRESRIESVNAFKINIVLAVDFKRASITLWTIFHLFPVVKSLARQWHSNNNSNSNSRYPNNILHLYLTPARQAPTNHRG